MSNQNRKETPEQSAARKAAANHVKAATTAAHATLANGSSTFAERNRANIVLKRIKQGKPIH